MWLPFRIPYRWLPSTVWKNVSRIWYDLTHGLRNALRWSKVIWFDVDWDWSSLADVMEYKLTRMAENHEKYQVVTSWERTARQCRICAYLLQRLKEDEYWDRAVVQFGHNKAAVVKETEAAQKADQELLGKLIGKYLTHWWD